MSLTGTNFVQNLTSIEASSKGILPLSVRVDSPTSAVATLLLHMPGVTNLTVKTPSGTTSSEPFLVIPGTLSQASEYTVSAFLGPEGGIGSSDGIGNARFFSTAGIWSDGNLVYIADANNSTIRSLRVKNQEVATIAGRAGDRGAQDGIGNDATFGVPWGLWGDGQTLYVTDLLNYSIRKIDLVTGEVSTFAGSSNVDGLEDGVGVNARFLGPTGIWGNATDIYVADTFLTSTRVIRKISRSTAAVTTVATLGNAAFSVYGVGLWGDETNLWIADTGRHIIRRMPLSTGTTLTTVAGTDNLGGHADGTSALFRNPSALWGIDGEVFIADTENSVIRKLTIATGAVTTLAGSPGAPDWVDATGSAARFILPAGIWGTGTTVYVTDLDGHTVREVNTVNGSTSTIAGQAGPSGFNEAGGAAARFQTPWGISGDASGLYISDFLNSVVRRSDFSGSESPLLAGSPGSFGTQDGPLANARFALPSGLWSDGMNLYVTDELANSVRRIDLGSGLVSTLAGSTLGVPGAIDATGTAARFSRPEGIWGDGIGGLYVADFDNSLVRFIDIASGNVTTFAGTQGTVDILDGVGTAAHFSGPKDIWGDGTSLYVLDLDTVRRVDIATRAVTTYAGSPFDFALVNGDRQTARFSAPFGLWGDGTSLYIADTGNHAIRKIHLATGVVSTIAGTDVRGSENGNGTAARFFAPSDVWGDGSSLFIVDSENHRIRKISPASPQPGPSDRSFTLTSQSGVSSTTVGAGGLQTGYGRIISNGGSNAPSGIAIFGYRQNGILVSEAAVPASPLLLSGRIYAEVAGRVNTGLAIANPGGQSANITFEYADASGTTVYSGSTTLNAGNQIAAFLDQAPFNTGGATVAILASVRTFTFSSSSPVSVVALRGFYNERPDVPDFLITTLPVTPVGANSGAPVTLPHYADGGGWRTQVILVNPTDAAISGTVEFYSQGTETTPGAPVTLTVNGLTATSFAYAIPGRGALKLETAGTLETTLAGSVRVTPNAGTASPSGLLVFSYRPGSITVSEAGVPVSENGTAFRMYAEVTDSVETGIAIGNPSDSNVTVNFELTTLDGTPVGLSGSTTVPARGQVAAFLSQIPGFAAISRPFRGTLRISGANVSVIGLRTRYNERSDFLITTTAPVSESQPPLPAEFVFPHFADGGGYTTQLILFNATPGQTSSGVLRFYDQSGTQLNLPMQ